MPIIGPAYAVIVTVSNYEQLQRVPRCVRTGAEELRDFLIKEGGYQADNVKFLADDRANTPHILGALDALVSCEAEATVFLYFAGHGARIEQGPQAGDYFVTKEADRSAQAERIRHALSATMLTEAIERIPAYRLMLVLDCCDAGALAEARDPRWIERRPPLFQPCVKRLPSGRGRVVLAATRTGESAWANARRGYTVMCEHLLAGLRGGTSSAGGCVRVFDLAEYIIDRIEASANPQTPVFKAELESNFPIARTRATPLSIAPFNDDYQFDVYISSAEPDRAWVRNELLSRLQQLGIRTTTIDDFRLGVPILSEMERAVISSRYTLAVLSKAGMSSGFANLDRVLARHLGSESDEYRLLSVLREPSPLNLSIRIAPPLDMTDAAELDANAVRLAEALRQPRPRGHA